MYFFDTPPEQLAGDAITAVHRAVAQLGGDIDWYRQAVDTKIAACDPLSAVEPVMAAALTGMVACGWRISFESQVPVAGFVVDFAVTGPYDGWYGRRHPGSAVAVEVDGLQYHLDAAADRQRDEHLARRGWPVERFPAALLLKVLYAADYPYEKEHHGWHSGPEIPPELDLVTFVAERLRPPRREGRFVDRMVVDRQEHLLPSNPFADPLGDEVESADSGD